MESSPQVKRLAELGINEQQVTQLLDTARAARAELRKACGGEKYNDWLASVGKDSANRQTFETAVEHYYVAAKAWMGSVVHLLLDTPKYKTEQPPPAFELCAYGSFGRGEMAPYSDCDVVVLCNNAEEERLIGFVNDLSVAYSQLRFIPGQSNVAFQGSFELAFKQYTVTDLLKVAASLPLTELSTVCHHSLHSPTEYSDAFNEGRGSPLTNYKPLAARGLDSACGGSRYTSYLKPRGNEPRNAKNLVAFFQRGLCTLYVLKAGHQDDPNTATPNATSKRVQSINHDWHGAYWAVMALRFTAHFKAGKEEEDVPQDELRNRNIPHLDEAYRGIDELLRQHS